jgi:NAD(P)-dependent dehydrogenase (short-subunit alcohol dehydrogenase family)
MRAQKNWFVTGASKGLGLALVRKLIAAGYNVAATSRNLSELIKATGKQSSSFLPLQVELTNEESVLNAIHKTIETFGAVDVVVNNAGFGQLGTLEELSDHESRKNFDVNVFGTLNVIRSVMPYFRTHKKGIVFNIASVGGFMGDFAGWGIYCATKFAVAGLTESFAAEVKEFGVKASIVYPGYFRTNFLSEGSLQTSKNQIEAYSEARKIQALHETEINRHQPGDPEKAADVLIDISKMEDIPLHLFLGSDAFQMADQKLSALKNELMAYENVSKSTDFEKVPEHI